MPNNIHSGPSIAIRFITITTDWTTQLHTYHVTTSTGYFTGPVSARCIVAASAGGSVLSCDSRQQGYYHLFFISRGYVRYDNNNNMSMMSWTDINTIPNCILLHIITRLRGPVPGADLHMDEPLHPGGDDPWGCMIPDTTPHAGVVAAAADELSSLAALRLTNWRLYRLIDDNRDAIVAAFTRCVVRGNVTQWFFCHIFHRDSEPAVITDNSGKYIDTGDSHVNQSPSTRGHSNTEDDSVARWYHMGARHRGDDLPAVIHSNDVMLDTRTTHSRCDTQDAIIKEWYVGDQRHRDDGRPAVVTPIRTEYWARGRLHRDVLPAICGPFEWCWFTHGLCHRLDGPAKIYTYVRRYVDKDDDPTELGYELHINDDADLKWYRDGVLHRDGDLPAVMLNYGAMGWFDHGRLHRGGDLPAIIDGPRREWWDAGERHRGGWEAGDGDSRWRREDA
jgi:hypothetical protein